MRSRLVGGAITCLSFLFFSCGARTGLELGAPAAVTRGTTGPTDAGAAPIDAGPIDAGPIDAGPACLNPQIVLPVGNNPNAVAVGDFNGDGKLDIAAANNSDGTISILLNTGNATFAGQMTYGEGRVRMHSRSETSTETGGPISRWRTDPTASSSSSTWEGVSSEGE